MTFDIVAMETDILSAIRKGYFQQVRLLVKSGLDVNVRDPELRTPLIYCALVDERWGVGLARTLLASGALVGLTDRSGLGPLHYATILGKTKLLRIFLNAADFDINLGDALGNTALHYAAATGSVAAVESLLVTCVRYRLRVDSLNRNGRTAEDMALENRRSQCAEVIRQTRERLKVRSSSLPRVVSVPDMAILLQDEKSQSLLSSSSSDREQKPRRASIYRWPDAEDRYRTASFYSTNSNIDNDDDAADAILDIIDYGLHRKSELRLIDRHSTALRPTKLDPPQSNGNDRLRSPAEDKTLRGYKAVIRRLQGIGVILAAPAKDPRSNPSKLLGQSASDFFSASANQATISPTLSAENWRSTINSLYTDFYFQFSATYRTPVRIVDRERNGSSDGGGGGGSEMRPRPTSGIQRAPSSHRLVHGKLTGNGDQSRARKPSSVLPPRVLKRSAQKSSIT